MAISHCDDNIDQGHIQLTLNVTTIGSGVNGQVGCQPGHGSQGLFTQTVICFLSQWNAGPAQLLHGIWIHCSGTCGPHLHGASLSYWHNLPKMAKQSGDVSVISNATDSALFPPATWISTGLVWSLERLWPFSTLTLGWTLRQRWTTKSSKWLGHTYDHISP